MRTCACVSKCTLLMSLLTGPGLNRLDLCAKLELCTGACVEAGGGCTLPRALQQEREQEHGRVKREWKRQQVHEKAVDLVDSVGTICSKAVCRRWPNEVVPRDVT
jgi:hypothetical protein